MIIPLSGTRALPFLPNQSFESFKFHHFLRQQLSLIWSSCVSLKHHIGSALMIDYNQVKFVIPAI